MEQEKISVFNDFSRRAKEKIEARKKNKTKQLYIGDCDVTITIRGMSEQEINDVNEFSNNSLENDKYLIYMSCKELQAEAEALVNDGTINKHYEIANMFSIADRNAIANEILKLSGIFDESTVKAVDEIEETKN